MNYCNMQKRNVTKLQICAKFKCETSFNQSAFQQASGLHTLPDELVLINSTALQLTTPSPDEESLYNMLLSYIIC